MLHRHMTHASLATCIALALASGAAAAPPASESPLLSRQLLGRHR